MDYLIVNLSQNRKPPLSADIQKLWNIIERVPDASGLWSLRLRPSDLRAINRGAGYKEFNMAKVG